MLDLISCNKCGENNPISHYPKNKGGKLGIKRICKKCTSSYRKNYSIVNKGELQEYNKSYYIENKIDLLNKIKIYSSLNRDKINNRTKSKYHSNFNIKLHRNTRKTISNAFKTHNTVKSCRTIDILGCSIEEFKIYIESKFENWMNWNNYGNPIDNIYELNKTWDLDHVIPISTATTKEDIIRLNNYTNFQPMCSFKNRWIKSNKLIY